MFSPCSLRLPGSPREPLLRKARVCYDHLAGELGVLAFDGLQHKGVFNNARPGEMELTEAGQTWFKALGVDAVVLSAQRRCFCRPCLDWGERRNRQFTHYHGSIHASQICAPCPR